MAEIEFVTSVGIICTRHLLQSMNGGFYFLLGGGLREECTEHIKTCKFVKLRAIEITKEIMVWDDEDSILELAKKKADHE